MQIIENASLSLTTHITVHIDAECPVSHAPGSFAAIIQLWEGPSRGFRHVIAASIGNTTKNRMEQKAAIASMRFIRDTYAAAFPITVYSVSNYVADGMSLWLHKWKTKNWSSYDKSPVKNRDLWEALVDAAEGLRVEWKWLRSNLKDPDNKAVDALAKTELERYRSAT
ncbi:RNase H family protein [Brucella sp.]|uniref:RNase H family protein n=1 Tax=Brucella sp. TaxID=52132 RepID=UPI0028AA522D|nr:RNase H family protein [Brucella sp.]